MLNCVPFVLHDITLEALIVLKSLSVSFIHIKAGINDEHEVLCLQK